MREKTMYYFFVVISLLNIIGFASQQQWIPIGCFLLVFILSIPFNIQRIIVLLFALLISNLCKSMYVDGMKNPTSKDKSKSKPTVQPKPSSKMTELNELLNGDSFEGLTQKTDNLVKRQKNLFAMANQMMPMMKQASDMMKQLPDGFLDTAMEHFKENQKNNKI